MIHLNRFDSLTVNPKEFASKIEGLLSDQQSPMLGGVFCPANLETERKLAEALGAPCVLTSSGTTALLLAIEYAQKLAADRPIIYCVSEFLYFSLVSHIQAQLKRGAKLQILKANADEVSVEPAVYSPGCFHIFLLTSHHNQNANINAAVFNIPKTEIFVIEDRCLVLGNKQHYSVDAACFSFSNNKLIMAGEGGCVSSHRPEFLTWAKWRTFSGIVPLSKAPTFMYMAMYNSGEFDMPYKCSIPAIVALLIQQSLEKLSLGIEKRVRNYAFLLEHLTFCENQPPLPKVPLFYPLVLPKVLDKKGLRKFQLLCLRLGMQTHLGVLPYSFFQTKDLKKKIISLPVHGGLTPKELYEIVDITKRALAYDV